MNRREFITLLSGAAAFPLVARAQQGDRVRRIGLLLSYDENDPLAKPQVSAFTQALAELGWIDGRNVRMDVRWGGDDINRIRALAQELVGLQPDIIQAVSAPVTFSLQRETRTIPIVFVNVADPVASGLVERLDRPSGNVTGFGSMEATLAGKWLELLSEIAPGLKRAAIMFNPDTALVSTFMPSFETAARSRPRRTEASSGASSVPPLKYPITGIARCCARAASGHAASSRQSRPPVTFALQSGTVHFRGSGIFGKFEGSNA
jgi:putative ABC transport system substrate-binding protein